VPKRQKNFRMSTATAAKLDALSVIHGTDSEAMSVAIDVLYRLAIEEQAILGESLESVRVRIRKALGRHRYELTFRHAPGQALIELPEWTELCFANEDMKATATRSLRKANLTPHPATVVAGVVLTLRTEEVLGTE
jgi:hypothetical protein